MRWRNHCCRGKAISITYLCVHVHDRGRVSALLQAYLSSMPRAGAIFSAFSLVPPYFSILCHKRLYFRGGKKSLNTKYVLLFSLRLFLQTFLILRIKRDIVINVKKSSYKVPVIFVGFERNLNFLDRFSKKSEI